MTMKSAKHTSEFSEILSIIRSGRTKAFQTVNVTLIETYWAVGEHLSRKVAEASWGKGIVKELSEWLLAQASELKGFSASDVQITSLRRLLSASRRFENFHFH